MTAKRDCRHLSTFSKPLERLFSFAFRSDNLHFEFFNYISSLFEFLFIMIASIFFYHDFFIEMHMRVEGWNRAEEWFEICQNVDWICKWSGVRRRNIFDHKALEFELMSSVSEKYWKHMDTKLFKLNLSILISRIIFRPLLLQNQELSNVKYCFL